MKEKAVAYN
ncbi:hypothetical protein AYI68_g7185, partial [Smittium mucronatum]